MDMLSNRETANASTPGLVRPNPSVSLQGQLKCYQQPFLFEMCLDEEMILSAQWMSHWSDGASVGDFSQHLGVVLPKSLSSLQVKRFALRCNLTGKKINAFLDLDRIGGVNTRVGWARPHTLSLDWAGIYVQSLRRAPIIGRYMSADDAVEIDSFRLTADERETRACCTATVKVGKHRWAGTLAFVVDADGVFWMETKCRVGILRIDRFGAAVRNHNLELYLDGSIKCGPVYRKFTRVRIPFPLRSHAAAPDFLFSQQGDVMAKQSRIKKTAAVGDAADAGESMRIQTTVALSILKSNLVAVVEKDGANGIRMLVTPADESSGEMSIKELVDEINAIIGPSGPPVFEQDVVERLRMVAEETGAVGFDPARLKVSLRQAFLLYGQGAVKLEYAFSLRMALSGAFGPKLGVFDIESVGISIWNTDRKTIIDKMRLFNIDDYLLRNP